MNNFLEITLPKWPQMLVSGKDVTVEQAKEIIFRTDDFLTDPTGYAGGNNHRFHKHYMEISGLGKFNKSIKHEDDDCRWDKINTFKEHIGAIPASYVTNDWASCSYVGGPNGWCSPEGKIAFYTNVGKWPSVGDVLADWEKIAAAFPFLDLTATLMSGEYCVEGIVPLVNIRVKDGKAALEKGDSSHANFDLIMVENEFDAFFESKISGESDKFELGLPPEWYDEFAARVNSVLHKMNFIS